METATKPKPDLSTDQLEWKEFEVVKYISKELYHRKRCWVSRELEEMEKQLCKAGLQKERLLLEILTERVNTHNGQLKTACTKIDALRKEGWWRSKLFHGIGLDIDKCKKLARKFQHFDTYEIHNVYFDPIYEPQPRKEF